MLKARLAREPSKPSKDPSDSFEDKSLNFESLGPDAWVDAILGLQEDVLPGEIPQRRWAPDARCPKFRGLGWRLTHNPSDLVVGCPDKSGPCEREQQGREVFEKKSANLCIEG
jgi:hypothetical protein